MVKKVKAPRLVVAGLVIKNGKYLLVKEKLGDGKEYWIVPGGGVEFGESLEQAIIREMKEETNLDVYNVEFLNFKEAIFPSHNYHTVIFFFKLKVKKVDMKLEDQVLDAQFFTKSELKNILLVESAEWLFNSGTI